MGTVVHVGQRARAWSWPPAPATQFGRHRRPAWRHQLETEFQAGLRPFSLLLVQVAGVLTISIFVINVVLHDR